MMNSSGTDYFAKGKYFLITIDTAVGAIPAAFSLEVNMDWWIWALIGAAVIVMLAAEFVIIGGPDPRKWKGGGRKR